MEVLGKNVKEKTQCCAVFASQTRFQRTTAAVLMGDQQQRSTL